MNRSFLFSPRWQISLGVHSSPRANHCVESSFADGGVGKTGEAAVNIFRIGLGSNVKVPTQYIGLPGFLPGFFVLAAVSMNAFFITTCMVVLCCPQG